MRRPKPRSDTAGLLRQLYGQDAQREKNCTVHHHACDCREAEFAALRAEAGALREAVEYAAHAMEKGRIWNGTDWHYNPLHPLNYRSALERLREALTPNA